MRTGNQQILLILAVFFGVLCALSPPTFGESFSDFETFDAQQFLSDAKAKQVAEAAKRGALVGFIISAVLCFVLFPIDDKRLLKVLIIIAATAGGYFGGALSGSGPLASEEVRDMQSQASKGRARRAGLDMDKEFKRMDRMGTDQVGVDKVLDKLLDIKFEKATAVDPKDVIMMEEQIRRLVPALQKQLDAIVKMSDDAADFATKFGGAGVALANEIARATGVPIKEVMEQIKTQLKTQALGKEITKDRRESMKRQAEVGGKLDEAQAARDRARSAADAGGRLVGGRQYTDASGATQRFGGLSQPQMKRFSDPSEIAKLDKLRTGREKEARLRAMPRGGIRMTGGPLGETARADAAKDRETKAYERGDIDAAGEERKEFSKIIREYLERILGKDNVTDEDVAAAVHESYEGGDAFEDFVKSRRKSLEKERLETESENVVIETDLQRGPGGLGASQLLTLLENPALFEALTKDIDRFMKGLPAAEPEPREEAKPVVPESVQKPTIAEEVQTREPQKRSRRRQRRMEAR